jgi:Na+/H+-dicarboxylate symporter
MMIASLIFTTVVVGIARIGDLKEVGRPQATSRG